MGKRIGLFVNGFDDSKKLLAGENDVKRLYSIMTNQTFGSCDKTLSMYKKNIKSRKEFRDLLDHILEKLDFGDQFIFYFSGHGDHKGSTYHLKFGKELYSFDTFLSELNSYEINKAIVIIDACFSGSTVVSKNTNIKLPELPEGIAILSSSSANEFSFENDDNEYSLFTDLLCKCIETGNGKKITENNLIGLVEIIKFVKKNNNHKKKQQQPKYKILNAGTSIWISKNTTLNINILKLVSNDLEVEAKVSETKNLHTLATKYTKILEHKYENIPISVLNDLRHAGEHSLNALSEKEELKIMSELVKSQDHSKRALCDALEFIAVNILEELMNYHKAYGALLETHQSIPDYQNLLLKLEKLKKQVKDFRSKDANNDFYLKISSMEDTILNLEEILNIFILHVPTINVLISQNNSVKKNETRNFIVTLLFFITSIIVFLYLFLK